TSFGPFLIVQVDNDVSLDFADDHGPVHPQHYAFLVEESERDAIFGRSREPGLPCWGDPMKKRPGEFNTNDGGRGVYWEDPSGHFLEIITRPYGSGPRPARCPGGGHGAPAAPGGAGGGGPTGRRRRPPARRRPPPPRGGGSGGAGARGAGVRRPRRPRGWRLS